MVWEDRGDAELVQALRRGDDDAFAWLLDRYDASLRRLARGFVASDAVAAEVVQETWLGVIRGLDRFEQRSSLKTWIFRILLNTARSRGVHEHRSVPFSASDPIGADDGAPTFPPDRFRPAGDEHAGWWATPPDAWDPHGRFERKETLDLVRSAVEALPAAQRIVISLRDIDGWTSDEVCTELGISPANQRVLLHRARSRVRSALDEYLRPVGAR